MRTSFAGLLSCLAMGWALVSWADEPASPAPAAPSAATSATPAATAPAPSPTAAPAASAAAKVAVDEPDKRLLSMGYKVKKENGSYVYCRREPVVGSRFDKLVCGSAEQLQAVRDSARQATERIQRTGLAPITSSP